MEARFARKVEKTGVTFVDLSRQGKICVEVIVPVLMSLSGNDVLLHVQPIMQIGERVLGCGVTLGPSGENPLSSESESRACMLRGHEGMKARNAL